MMKKILMVLFSICTTLSFAQSYEDSTHVLLNTKPLKLRGQFTFEYESSEVNKSSIHSIGIGFGLIANKRFYFDLYGNVSVNSPEKISFGDVVVDPIVINELSFIHGGTRVGYKFKPYRAVHLATILKFGTASIQSNDSDLFTSVSAFTFTPQIEGELNLTRSIKLGIGIGYRFTSRKDDFFKRNETNGFTFHTSFRFGRFAK